VSTPTKLEACSRPHNPSKLVLTKLGMFTYEARDHYKFGGDFIQTGDPDSMRDSIHRVKNVSNILAREVALPIRTPDRPEVEMLFRAGEKKQKQKNKPNQTNILTTHKACGASILDTCNSTV
jgi:hypothetical protein